MARTSALTTTLTQPWPSDGDREQCESGNAAASAGCLWQQPEGCAAHLRQKEEFTYIRTQMGNHRPFASSAYSSHAFNLIAFVAFDSVGKHPLHAVQLAWSCGDQ